MEETEKERKVVHLHIKYGDHHEYYGSIASVFDFHTSEELGVSYGYLRNIAKSLTEENKAYHNEKCTIRFGRLRQKKMKIGKSKK